MTAPSGQDHAIELLNLLFNVGEADVEDVNSGTAVTLSTSIVASITALTLNGATPVITMPAPQAPGAKKTVYVIQDATGSRVPSWAGATINWIKGTAPVLSTTPAAIDKLTFESIDGTTWEAIADLANAGTLAVFSSPGLVSGTAKQDATGQWSTWYIKATGAASGTLAVAIGPTSGVADAIIPAFAIGATTDGAAISVRLPPNWFIKATVVNGSIDSATVVTG